DTGRQQAHIIGEILHDLVVTVKSHDERMVIMRTNGVLKKSDRGILLELEARMDRPAGIDEQAHLQRKIGLLLEINNFLWRLVIVEKAEIILVQIANEFAMLVHRNKKDIL